MKFEAHSLRHIVKQIKEALAGTQINSRIKIAQCITMQTPQFVTYFLSLSLLWGGLKRPGTNAGEPEVPPPECQVPFRECCLLRQERVSVLQEDINCLLDKRKLITTKDFEMKITSYAARAQFLIFMNIDSRNYNN